MSRIFFLPNMSIKTDESLADAGFSRSVFPIPPYAFLSGMLIRRDQLISPDDYLPGREWVNGSAVAHLLRAPALFLPPALFPLTHARSTPIRVPLSSGFSPSPTVASPTRYSFFPVSVHDPDLSPVIVHGDRRFIVSFPRPVDAAAMLVLDSRIIYNRGGHATARKHQKHRIRTEQMKVLLSAAR